MLDTLTQIEQILPHIDNSLLDTVSWSEEIWSLERVKDKMLSPDLLQKQNIKLRPLQLKAYLVKQLL